MKKILVCFLAVVMLFSFTACLDGYEGDYSDSSHTFSEESYTQTVTSNTEDTNVEESSKNSISSETSVTSSKVQSTSSKNTSSTASKNSQSSVTTTPSKPTNTDALVWVPTNGGKKYHSKSSCSNMKNPRQVTKQTAINEGFGPCGRCY